MFFPREFTALPARVDAVRSVLRRAKELAAETGLLLYDLNDPAVISEKNILPEELTITFPEFKCRYVFEEPCRAECYTDEEFATFLTELKKDFFTVKPLFEER